MSFENGPNPGIQESVYKSLVRPFLKNEPGGEYYSYFRQQAWRLWVLGFETQKDAHKIGELQKGYARLYTQNTPLFLEIVSNIYSKLHDTRVIVELTATNYQEAQETKKPHSVFEAGFNYYKSLFESEFSLWISLFYASFQENKQGLASPVNYVGIPASQKFKHLEDAKLNSVLEGINKTIRNAGAGHENWELDDNGDCIYRDTDIKTGLVRDTFKITQEDLGEELKAIEKATAIIDISIHIFLANNPQIDVRASRPSKSILKVEEIRRITMHIAADYQLEIVSLSFDKDRKHLCLEVGRTNTERPSIHASKVYSNIGAYEVVKMAVGVSYIDQAISLLNHIIHLNGDNCFDFSLKITDKAKGVVFDDFFERHALEEWVSQIGPNKPKAYPVTRSGSPLPETSYSLIVSHCVEFGEGNEIQRILNNPLFTYDYKNFLLAYHRA